MKSYDLIIKNGRIVTSTETKYADIGISDQKIIAIGNNLVSAKETIDASGKYILPGGIDSHCHVEQKSASGLVNSDTFESATKAAALGGNTSIIPFAAQYEGFTLTETLQDYHKLAKKGSIIDYAMHMIIAGPNDYLLNTELPEQIKLGHSSVKIFMTYDRLKIEDIDILNIFEKARAMKAFISVHAENHGMITWMVSKLLEKGYTHPKFHSVSHPVAGEVEAINRIIGISELMDQPVMIFHVSSEKGVEVIRKAQARGIKIFAETCVQYLTLTSDAMDKPGVEGGKWICSPPLRKIRDQNALWDAVKDNTLCLISSDHAPYSFDSNGKLFKGKNPNFKEIPNGMPGLNWRLPILFDEIVSKSKKNLNINDFVRLTSTTPAKIYGLYPQKGDIEIGFDADLVIWDSEVMTKLSDDMVVDGSGYNPYSGRIIKGWPETVFLRGSAIVSNNQVIAKPGNDNFLPTKLSPNVKPKGVVASDLLKQNNYGAILQS